MKMKNVVFGYLALSLGLATIVHADEHATVVVAPQDEQIVAPSHFLASGSLSPLHIATKRLRSYFAGITPYGIGLHTRGASKTVQFNGSLIKFIKEVYNNSSYPHQLSQDPGDLVDFLHLSNELNLDIGTVGVCMRLFYNKFKECEIIDDYVAIRLLESLPLLERYFDVKAIEPKEDLSFIKNHIEQQLLSRFTENFAQFQIEPDQFMSNLAQGLAQDQAAQLQTTHRLLTKQAEDAETVTRLRSTVLRLTELMIGRIMWNSVQPTTIWPSFLAISAGLQDLGNHKLIDHMDDLDDGHWSVLLRFCYYLDLCGANLPIDFYEEVEEDLANKSIFFLEAQEQDEGIRTKKQHLAEALMKAKTKALAFASGLMVS